MGLYSGGLIIGRIFASENWGAYFRDGLFIYLFIYFGWGGGGGEVAGLFIGILSYFASLFGSYAFAIFIDECGHSSSQEN